MSLCDFICVYHIWTSSCSSQITDWELLCFCLRTLSSMLHICNFPSLGVIFVISCPWLSPLASHHGLFVCVIICPWGPTTGTLPCIFGASLIHRGELYWSINESPLPLWYTMRRANEDGELATLDHVSTLVVEYMSGPIAGEGFRYFNGCLYARLVSKRVWHTTKFRNNNKAGQFPYGKPHVPILSIVLVRYILMKFLCHKAH